MKNKNGNTSKNTIGKTVKKVIKVLSIIVAVVIFIGVVGISIFTGVSVADGMVNQNAGKDTEEASRYQLNTWEYDTENFETNVEMTKLFLEGVEGYQVPIVTFGHGLDKDKDTVVLVHGLGGDYICVYPQVEFYLDNGFNVIAMDQRGSGDSSDEKITFGFYEQEDIKTIVNYVKDEELNGKLYLHGFSMGAATIGMYSGTEHSNENVDGIILDSVYDSMENVFRVVWQHIGEDIPADSDHIDIYCEHEADYQNTLMEFIDESRAISN